MDLCDDDDDDDFEVRIIGPAGRKPTSSSPADGGPAPFVVKSLCQPDETVEQMLVRVGEDAMLELVSTAQQQGRRIVGAQLLGLPEEPDKPNGFDMFSRTIIASQLDSDKKAKEQTERALRGEVQFHRERDYSSRWCGRGYNRGGFSRASTARKKTKKTTKTKSSSRKAS